MYIEHVHMWRRQETKTKQSWKTKELIEISAARRHQESELVNASVDTRKKLVFRNKSYFPGMRKMEQSSSKKI